jgi:hypothetical protein
MAATFTFHKLYGLTHVRFVTLLKIITAAVSGLELVDGKEAFHVQDGRWHKSVEAFCAASRPKAIRSPCSGPVLGAVPSDPACSWRIHKIKRQSASGTTRDSASASDTKHS